MALALRRGTARDKRSTGMLAMCFFFVTFLPFNKIIFYFCFSLYFYLFCCCFVLFCFLFYVFIFFLVLAFCCIFFLLKLNKKFSHFLPSLTRYAYFLLFFILYSCVHSVGRNSCRRVLSLWCNQL